jgi:hypothetical protein
MNSNKMLIDWLFRFSVQLPSVGVEGLMAFMETRDPSAFFSPLFFDGLLVQYISAKSWRPVLVVEEAGVPGENHQPWASNW